MRSALALAFFLGVAIAKAVPRAVPRANATASAVPKFHGAVLSGSESYASTFEIEVVEMTPIEDDGNSTGLTAITDIVVAPEAPVPTGDNSTSPVVVVRKTSPHSGLVQGPAVIIEPAASNVNILELIDSNSTGPVPTVIVEPLNSNASHPVSTHVHPHHNSPDLGIISPFLCEYTTIPGYCCTGVTTNKLGMNCQKADMFMTPNEQVFYFCPPDTYQNDMFVSACCGPDSVGSQNFCLRYFNANCWKEVKVTQVLNIYDCELAITYTGSNNTKRSFDAKGYIVGSTPNLNGKRPRDNDNDNDENKDWDVVEIVRVAEDEDDEHHDLEDRNTARNIHPSSCFANTARQYNSIPPVIISLDNNHEALDIDSEASDRETDLLTQTAG